MWSCQTNDDIRQRWSSWLAPCGNIHDLRRFWRHRVSSPELDVYQSPVSIPLVSKSPHCLLHKSYVLSTPCYPWWIFPVELQEEDDGLKRQFSCLRGKFQLSTPWSTWWRWKSCQLQFPGRRWNSYELLVEATQLGKALRSFRFWKAFLTCCLGPSRRQTPPVWTRLGDDEMTRRNHSVVPIVESRRWKCCTWQLKNRHFVVIFAKVPVLSFTYSGNFTYLKKREIFVNICLQSRHSDAELSSENSLLLTIFLTIFRILCISFPWK